MLKSINFKKNIRQSQNYYNIINNKYHTYPDPNDKGVISTYKYSGDKLHSKSKDDCKIDGKFRLDKPFPGTITGSGIEKNSYQTYSTKLSNGLIVASQDLPSLMSSFTLLVNSGSANEIQTGDNNETGATHASELLAFRGTSSRTTQELLTEIEMLGGNIQCVSTRESIIYCVDVLRVNLPKAINILSDVVLNPNLTDDDIEECKMVMEFQQNELPSELLSRDAIQIAGYKNSPLSNSHFCPLDKIPNITKELITNYRKKHFVSENIVISGSGVEHESFLQLVSENFKNISSNKDYDNIRKSKKPSKYTGGIILNQRPLKEPYIKIALGYEIGGWTDKQFVAACVLQQLLGGGSSFSAGGPGKGMYTRLYRNVLNKHHWIESAESFVSVHNESGIFGIDGATTPNNSVNMIQVIIDQLARLAIEQVSDEELNRAKNMLRSMMMMQLESRLVICEDIARQFATFGFRESPQDVSFKIESTTKKDLQDVANRLFNSPPSIGCVGEDLSSIPNYEDIKHFSENYIKQARLISKSNY